MGFHSPLIRDPGYFPEGVWDVALGEILTSICWESPTPKFLVFLQLLSQACAVLSPPFPHHNMVKSMVVEMVRSPKRWEVGSIFHPPGSAMTISGI